MEGFSSMGRLNLGKQLLSNVGVLWFLDVDYAHAVSVEKEEESSESESEEEEVHD